MCACVLVCMASCVVVAVHTVNVIARSARPPSDSSEAPTDVSDADNNSWKFVIVVVIGRCGGSGVGTVYFINTRTCEL